jgi:hypothetical protein
MTETHTCQIHEAHCENCGSTDYENVFLGEDGYTACCNECISYGPSDCRNHHVETGTHDEDPFG